MERLLHEMNIAVINADPALATACRLRAEALLDDPATPDATRDAAARFLWDQTGLPRDWALRLMLVTAPGTDAQTALDSAEWCARRVCCDLQRLRVLRALSDRDPRLVDHLIAAVAPK